MHAANFPAPILERARYLRRKQRQEARKTHTEEAAAMNSQKIFRLSAMVFVVCVLLVSGCNLRRKQQRQALMAAVEQKNATAVKHLLFSGVPADAGIPHGQTHPIHLAVERNDSKTVFLLIAFKADLNAPDEQGSTALYLALRTMNSGVIEKMLGMGAKPDAGSNDKSCLTYAALLGRSDLIPRLIAHGAAVDATDQHGETALMATINGALSTLQLRVSPPDAPYTEDHVGVVRELLKAGADPNRYDPYGMTPLMRAATVPVQNSVHQPPPVGPPQSIPSSPDYAILLLDAGADINARMENRADSEGRTALMIAAKQGNTPFVEMLLKRGAEASLRSNTSKTARDYARLALEKLPPSRNLPAPKNGYSYEDLEGKRLRLTETLKLLDNAAQKTPRKK